MKTIMIYNSFPPAPARKKSTDRPSATLRDRLTEIIVPHQSYVGTYSHQARPILEPEGFGFSTIGVGSLRITPFENSINRRCEHYFDLPQEASYSKSFHACDFAYDFSIFGLDNVSNACLKRAYNLQHVQTIS